MVKIRYDEITRCFGILANRVRTIGAKYLGEKGDMTNSERDRGKANDYYAKKEMIDSYGLTAPTNRRTYAIDADAYTKNRTKKGRGAGWGGDYSLPERENRDEFKKNYNNSHTLKAAAQRDRIETYRQITKDIPPKPEYHNEELTKRIVNNSKSRGVSFVTAKDGLIPNAMQKKFEETDAFAGNRDNAAIVPRMLGKDVLLMGANAKDQPALISHELAHLQQLKDKTYKRKFKLKNLFSKWRYRILGEGDTNDYNKASNVLNYISNRNRDEHDANRRGFVNSYLSGANEDALQNIHDWNRHSNATYDMYLLGYTPQNLDWNMDAEARLRMQEQIRQGND